MNKFKQSYFAGYFDGDGCFHLGKIIPKDRKSFKYIQSATVTSTNRKILEYLKSKFGGGIHKSKKPAGRATHKTIYHFSIRKKKGIEFTNEIIKLLVEKQDEAMCFLEFATTKTKDLIIEKMKLIKASNLVTKEMKSEFEAIRNTISPTKEDFAYLAGFIDAECCLTVNKYKTKNKPNYLYKILLQCNNTKYPIFKWLIERFGGQIHFIDRRSKNILHRDQLTWRLCSSSLAVILNKILPFLKYKKPVCKELIEFQKTILPKYGQRKTEEFRNSYKSIIDIREKIVHNIHILNKKGL